MLIFSLFIIGVALCALLIPFPFLFIAWPAAIVWGVYFYAMHEALTEIHGPNKATAVVVALGTLVCACLGLLTDEVWFTALGAVAVSLTLAMRWWRHTFLDEHYNRIQRT